MVVKSSSSARTRVNHTIYNAAKSGDTRKLLVALRNRIAQQLDGKISARDYASLSKRLMDVTMLIDAIDRGEAKDSPVSAALDVDDELLDGGDGEES
jgi:hypothetical protein